MALSERDRRALKLGIVALVLIAVYLLIGWHDGLVKRHDTLAGEVQRILADELKAKYYAEQVVKWEEKVGELTEPKPYSEQITAVGQKIMNAAGANGVNLKESTPTAPTLWPEDPKLQKASFVMEAEAEWEKIFQFINALYAIEGVLSVEHVELKSEGGKLKVAMTVSVLVMAPKMDELS